MLEPPTITLDVTLAELYAMGRKVDNSDRIAMVLCAANSEMELSTGIGRNTKYLYQDSTFSNVPEHLSLENYKEMQRHSAIKYLSLVPQVGLYLCHNTRE